MPCAWRDPRTTALAPFLNDQAIGAFNRAVDTDLVGLYDDMSTLEEPPTVPKTEHSEEDSFSDSSPELDIHDFAQESTQVQKRKGGRKPVCLSGKNICLKSHEADCARYTRRPRKGSRETDKHKQRSEKDGRNISNSWRQP